MRRGDLERAERIAREADAVVSGKQRLPWKIIGKVEQVRGNLQAAIEAIEHANGISVSPITAQTQRLRAVTQRELATLYAELGRVDLALTLITDAESALKSDPKHDLLLAAAAAFVHALRHEHDLAMARIEAACRARAQIPEDRATHAAVLLLLGRAALYIDEPEQAEAFFHDLVSLKSDPISNACVNYHLAECRRRQGDLRGGRELDLKAASTQFGTRWERLARDRLAREDCVFQ